MPAGTGPPSKDWWPPPPPPHESSQHLPCHLGSIKAIRRGIPYLKMTWRWARHADKRLPERPAVTEQIAASLDATGPRHYTSAVSSQQRRRSRVAVVAT